MCLCVLFFLCSLLLGFFLLLFFVFGFDLFAVLFCCSALDPRVFLVITTIHSFIHFYSACLFAFFSFSFFPRRTLEQRTEIINKRAKLIRRLSKAFDVLFVRRSLSVYQSECKDYQILFYYWMRNEIIRIKEQREIQSDPIERENKNIDETKADINKDEMIQIRFWCSSWFRWNKRKLGETTTLFIDLFISLFWLERLTWT